MPDSLSPSLGDLAASNGTQPDDSGYTPEQIQSMTHRLPQPNTAAPVIKGMKDFATGGVMGMLEGQGVQTPEWSKSVGRYINNPDIQAAAGMPAALGQMFLPLPSNLAKLADDAVAQGASHKDIWERFNIFKGADNRWRREISDYNSQMKPGWTVANTLGEAMEHPNLFNKVPQLAELPFKYNPTAEGYKGRWSPSGNFVEVTSKATDPRSTLLHEIMHVIQDSTGLNRGGSPAEFREEVKAVLMKRLGSAPERLVDSLSDEAYWKLAGETEARNVPFRAVIPPDQLKRFHPQSTEDVPRSQQIIKMKE